MLHFSEMGIASTILIKQIGMLLHDGYLDIKSSLLFSFTVIIQGLFY